MDAQNPQLWILNPPGFTRRDFWLLRGVSSAGCEWVPVLAGLGFFPYRLAGPAFSSKRRSCCRFFYHASYVVFWIPLELKVIYYIYSPQAPIKYWLILSIWEIGVNPLEGKWAYHRLLLNGALAQFNYYSKFYREKELQLESTQAYQRESTPTGKALKPGTTGTGTGTRVKKI